MACTVYRTNDLQLHQLQKMVKKLCIIFVSVFYVSVAIEINQAVNRSVQGVFASQWIMKIKLRNWLS